MHGQTRNGTQDLQQIVRALGQLSKLATWSTCDRNFMCRLLFPKEGTVSKTVNLFLKIVRCIWARSWENVSYAICEQQRCRSACASAQSDQHLCCSLPRQDGTSSLYIRNFKVLAGLCSWAGQFVSCLVGDSRRHILSWRGSYECLSGLKCLFSE